MNSSSPTPRPSAPSRTNPAQVWPNRDDDDQVDHDDEADYDDDEDEGTVLAWHGRWSSHPQFGLPAQKPQ